MVTEGLSSKTGNYLGHLFLLEQKILITKPQGAQGSYLYIDDLEVRYRYTVLAVKMYVCTCVCIVNIQWNLANYYLMFI